LIAEEKAAGAAEQAIWQAVYEQNRHPGNGREEEVAGGKTIREGTATARR